jgi:hypothetical protein
MLWLRQISKKYCPARIAAVGMAGQYIFGRWGERNDFFRCNGRIAGNHK